MHRLFSVALNGETGATLRFFAALTLLVGGIFVALGGAGCGSPSPSCGGSDNTSYNSVGNTPFNASMSSPGGRTSQAAVVTRILACSGTGVTRMTWTPPPGASGFTFPGPQPQAGGPPFVFLNPPASFNVSFAFPDPGAQAQKYAETLECAADDGSKSYAGLVTAVQPGGASSQPADEPQAAGQPQSATSPQAAAPGADAKPGADMVFDVKKWRTSDGQTMTTELCQDWFDWLQSEDVFAALRVPVTVTHGALSFPLPVPFSPLDFERPVFQYQVDGLPSGEIGDVPLELRPDRATYLENNLPAAPGEHWLAMGLKSTPKVTCPAGMNDPAWEFFLSYPLDLVDKATALPGYYCYEGQAEPPVSAAARLLLGRDAAVQAEGITCLGPQIQSLTPMPGIEIGHPGAAWNIIPPDKADFLHYLQQNSAAEVDLAAGSDKPGLTLAFYHGDDQAPDTTRPITNPWTPAGTFEFFWLVATAPQGTPPGAYTVAITATQTGDPSVTAQINDLLWVGEWVPPEEPQTEFKIYMPVIQK